MEYLENWQRAQSWWSDVEMREEAVAFYNAEFAKTGVDDPEVILPKVEARIKKIHPDYFEPKNPNREKPSADTGPSVKKKKDIDLSDLDEDEQRHMNEYIKMGMKPEKLMESIKTLRKQRAV